MVFPWREGVGVEPTQDLSQPRTGFEDQEAHRDQYLPVCHPNIWTSLSRFVNPILSKYSKIAVAYFLES
jgi:hypothetical protein